MIRPSGMYAVVAGRELPVTALGKEQVWVEVDGERRPFDLTGGPELVKIVTNASWGGRPVDISGVRGDLVGIRTNDRQLAEQESLKGDQYSGWYGETTVDQLADVTETRTVMSEGAS
jgi:hypothetical protein